MYPYGNMKLLIGSDGMNKPDINSQEVYFLQIGTFIVFNEVFNQEIIENIFGLKGQYDLSLFRNYELCFPITNEKKEILNNLRKFTKHKIEQGVTVLISESVIILLFTLIYLITVDASKHNHKEKSN